MGNEIRFIEIGEDGKPLSIRDIKQSDIAKCPTVILMPEHYREDGTCRHDEPICETYGCANHKFGGEIFCRQHMLEMGITE